MKSIISANLLGVSLPGHRDPERPVYSKQHCIITGYKQVAPADLICKQALTAGN